MKVLVVGDGMVVDATVSALLERGDQVRLLSPRAEAAILRWPAGVEAWEAAPASAGVAGAAEGCEAVLYLRAVREPWAGDAGRDGPTGAGPDIDVRGTRRVCEEAQRAGAARFVLLSSIRHMRSTSEHGHLLRKVEDVARAFRGVWTVVRAGMVYGPDEGALSALALMVRTLPVVPLLDGGKIQLQPVWHEDLGRALARAATAPEAAGRELHVAGPERVTLSDVVDRLCVEVGRNPTRVSVPGLLAALGAEAAGLAGVSLPARAAALAEIDGDTLLPDSIENALTSVLQVEPTLVRDGLARLVARVPERTPTGRAVVRRRFWADIEGSRRTARALRDEFRRRAADVLVLEEGPPPGRMIKKGSLLSARVPARGIVGLRVAEVAPDHVSAVTVDGDPLAGVVEVRFEERARALRVEIRIDGEATTMLDRVLLRAAGGLLDDLDWPGAVERIVAISGGTARAGVERE
ncbi:MAG TPA: NAD(P)H-binding protein, partial [Vicinamibacteria bacterium]|nr:NAD(P)H-binding protein [Vicinamibacteria bacterium]